MIPRRAAVLAAIGLLAALGQPSSGTAQAAPRPPAVSPGDLADLTARLWAVTAQAEALSDALDAAASSNAGLRIALDDLAEQHDQAQARLDQRVREVYISSGPRQLDGLQRILSPGSRTLSQRAGIATLGIERDLVQAAGQQSDQAQVLLAQAAQVRAGLQVQAAGVLAAQERARDLLARAETLAAQQQVAEDQRAALAAARTRLDSVSATVTIALTPAQTARSRAAARDQAPVLALIERAGSGIPAGYARTGTVLRGAASWYGPGFVGSPTASGAPYDPERLTCANKTLPLGTVLHVSANGREVNCLVTDRGPYVGDRILDMSRAGSRALGYDGVAQVGIEVLTTVTP